MAPHLIKSMHGQALTELSVSLLILVPLFLLVPLLGKYIDMKHSTVQAARYTSWERTAWYEARPKDSAAPVKDAKRIEKEVAQRLFSKGDLTIKSNDSRTWQANPLWQAHTRTALLKEFADIRPTQGNENDTPSISYDIIRIYNKSVNTVLWPIRQLEKVVGLNVIPSGFASIAHSTKAYYSPVIEIDVNNILNFEVFDGIDLTLYGQSALLTDGWTAQAASRSNQFKKRVEDLVPSVLFRPVMDPIKAIATYRLPVFGVAFAPELQGLDFGYVDTEPVGGGDPNCSSGGKGFNGCEF